MTRDPSVPVMHVGAVRRPPALRNNGGPTIGGIYVRLEQSRRASMPIAKETYRVDEYVRAVELQSLCRLARRVDAAPGFVVHSADFWAQTSFTPCIIENRGERRTLL
eukprot:7559412-Pyramimonas_sp.AAC.1